MTVAAQSPPAQNGRVVREAARRRTFAIISHPDAGKTTLTEKLLLYAGAVGEAGSVTARRGRRAATADWMGPGARPRQLGDVGLDGPRAAPRHLGHVHGSALRARGCRLQPARHARAQGLLGGHAAGA